MAPWTFRLAPKRPRRHVQKSFSGCAKCKARKIKCDETKPTCSRCADRGISCPGYSTTLKIRWSKHHDLQNKQPRVSGAEKLLSQFHLLQQDLPLPADEVVEADADVGNDFQSLGISLAVAELELLDNADGSCPVSDVSDSSVAQSSGATVYPGIDYSISTLDDVPINAGENLWMSSISLPNIHGQQHPLAPEGNTTTVPLTSDFIDDTFNHLTSSASPEFCHVTKCSDEIEDVVSSVRSIWPCAPDKTLLFNPARLLFPLEHLPTKLVEAYFTLVCPLFSTFDSQQNMFRSFVDQRWQASGAMFYTMLSMAAAKLGHQRVNFKSHALEYQSLALHHLYEGIIQATYWNTELLFVVLMLGLSTSWHDAKDLGLVHFKALQHAVLNCKIEYSDGSPPLEFFKDALIYWEMVTCFLGKDEYSRQGKLRKTSPAIVKAPRLTSGGRIRPHVWTGVASEPQAMFTRITRLIQQIGCLDPHSTSDFRQSVSEVEEELWRLELPDLHEIAHTGDDNTPAIHHLLTTEAYMFANFYQLYYAFPGVRRRRARKISEQSSNKFSRSRSWAQAQACLGSSDPFATGDIEDWVSLIGRNIIVRLEQIQTSSGTSCVQPLLLLVGSASLSETFGLEDSDNGQEILRMREFVLDRLGYFSLAFLSEPMGYVRLVVLEIFKRLDAGVKVFWIDVLHSMGLATIIG